MDSELPDYSPPEMKRYGASQTPTLVEKDSENTQYTFTPVIVVSTTESNKEWECIYPEIDNQAAIVTAILPSIDFAALKDEPLFNADVFIKKSQDGVISSAYVLKAYFT